MKVLLIKFISLYELVLIIRILIEWLVDYYTIHKHYFLHIFFKLTDYPLTRIRNQIKPIIFNIDFSPIIFYLLLELLKILIISI